MLGKRHPVGPHPVPSRPVSVPGGGEYLGPAPLPRLSPPSSPLGSPARARAHLYPGTPKLDSPGGLNAGTGLGPGPLVLQRSWARVQGDACGGACLWNPEPSSSVRNLDCQRRRPPLFVGRRCGAAVPVQTRSCRKETMQHAEPWDARGSLSAPLAAALCHSLPPLHGSAHAPERRPVVVIITSVFAEPSAAALAALVALATAPLLGALPAVAAAALAGRRAAALPPEPPKVLLVLLVVVVERLLHLALGPPKAAALLRRGPAVAPAAAAIGAASVGVAHALLHALRLQGLLHALHPLVRALRHLWLHTLLHALRHARPHARLLHVELLHGLLLLLLLHAVLLHALLLHGLLQRAELVLRLGLQQLRLATEAPLVLAGALLAELHRLALRMHLDQGCLQSRPPAVPPCIRRFINLSRQRRGL
mmetsp:Transcript_86193/g.244525  ORF Transcript_86193/g.244525 Transcript_86193/m.244525 type:complete len:422 (+) Transcript_86193:173-1438(+)